MLKTKVKASSITNLTDARYFAALEVEWLGFNLTPNTPQSISPTNLKVIKEWVDGVKIVGEFDLASAEMINEAVNLLDLDVVQVGRFVQLPEQQAITAPYIIKEFVVTADTTISDLREFCETFVACTQCFLLDFEKNGFDWASLETETHLAKAELKELCEDFPILLSIKINPSSLAQMLAELPIQGLSVNGGEEEKVGFKSFDELDEWFEELVIEI